MNKYPYNNPIAIIHNKKHKNLLDILVGNLNTVLSSDVVILIEYNKRNVAVEFIIAKHPIGKTFMENGKFYPIKKLTEICLFPEKFEI